ncbi:MAG: M48 family metalloprotease [Chlamydiia bacterium]
MISLVSQIRSSAPTFSNSVAVTLGATISLIAASVLYRYRNPLCYKLRDARFAFDEAIFQVGNRLIDKTIFPFVPSSIKIREESAFNRDFDPIQQAEYRKKLLEKGVDIGKIEEDLQAFFSLKERPYIHIEDLDKGSAAINGFKVKKIMLNRLYNINKPTAYQDFGHEIGHLLNEDPFKTQWLNDVICIYASFVGVKLLYDLVHMPSAASFIGCGTLGLVVYFEGVMSRQMEFHADRAGLKFVAHHGHLKDLLASHGAGQTPWEAFVTAVSWPMLPTFKEGIYPRLKTVAEMNLS